MMPAQSNPSPANQTKPRGNAAGFAQYLKPDVTSGFLVFLIALPLCLGISLASGFPPLAGIFAAIAGAVITPFLSNSELTIKGPAAGLIVIVYGCIADFGGDGMIGGFSATDAHAYRAAIAVAAAAACLQIAFAVLRAGILGEFFPSAAVHGMLAAIGVIIMIKQIPVALGVSAKGEPLEMLREIPHYIREANPAIAAIGLISLAIMFLWPVVRNRFAMVRSVPPQMVVLIASMLLGGAFDLLHEHYYELQHHRYKLGEQYLVTMPDKPLGMFQEITLPDFAVLKTATAWKWVFMFFAIGSLESLLSAKAVDMLDPWKRKSNLNRDILAVGCANLCAALVGGLPMISEIVRSRANIDNGAKTRFANLWHGIFLLLCVALIPTILHRIPLAALAAMLVYTGFRLAHPTEFVNVYRIGKEQLAIFVTTLVTVLATDLLVGVAAGIGLKLALHVANGVPLRSLWKPYIQVEDVDENTSRIVAHESAVFSNWIPFRRQIESIGLAKGRNIVVDLANTKLVDHSVMEKLEELRGDFEEEGLQLEITGLDCHVQSSDHTLARRIQGMARLRRIVVIADAVHEDRIVETIAALGTRCITRTSCRGALGLRVGDAPLDDDLIRVETIAEFSLGKLIVDALRRDAVLEPQILLFADHVEVQRREKFTPLSKTETNAELVAS